MDIKERELLKQEILEELLNSIPDVLGNLMAEHATNRKLRTDFYNKYNEFKDHKDIVSKVIEKFEGMKLGQSYEEILEKAVPDIRNQIKILGSSDISTVSKPSVSDRTLDLNEDHGEL